MKRKIGLVLVLVFIFSSAVPAIAADKPDSWAEAEVGAAITAGLVPSDLQASYRVNCTREDFCRLAVRLLEVKFKMTSAQLLSHFGLSADSGAFSDTHNEAILAANALGIVNGVGTGVFSPQGLLTREQAAAMLMRAARVLLFSPEGKPLAFGDSASFSSYAAGAIDFVSSCGVMSGTGGNQFSPQGSYTRQQAILTVYRLFSASPDPTSFKIMTPTEIYRACSPAVFSITARDILGQPFAYGSGFFINSAGVAVTNFHVINEAFSAGVKLPDGSEYEVESVLGYDIEKDIAVVKVSGQCFRYLPLGDPATVESGNKIYAIGNPQGLENTISDGIVSSANRELYGESFIQITAAISSGSSGGALVNEYGQAIGITTLSYVDGQNLNFAIPINRLSEIDRSAVLTFEKTAEAYACYLYDNTHEDVESGDIYYYPAREYEPNDTKDYADYIYSPLYAGVGTSDKDTPDIFGVMCNAPGDVTLTLVCEDDYYGNIYMTVEDSAGTSVQKVTRGTKRNGYYEIEYTFHADAADIYFVSVDTNAGKKETPYYLFYYLVPDAAVSAG